MKDKLKGLDAGPPIPDVRFKTDVRPIQACTYSSMVVWQGNNPRQ